VGLEYAEGPGACSSGCSRTSAQESGFQCYESSGHWEEVVLANNDEKVSTNSTCGRGRNRRNRKKDKQPTGGVADILVNPSKRQTAGSKWVSRGKVGSEVASVGLSSGFTAPASSYFASNGKDKERKGKKNEKPHTNTVLDVPNSRSSTQATPAAVIAPAPAPTVAAARRNAPRIRYLTNDVPVEWTRVRRRK